MRFLFYDITMLSSVPSLSGVARFFRENLAEASDAAPGVENLANGSDMPDLASGEWTSFRHVPALLVWCLLVVGMMLAECPGIALAAGAGNEDTKVSACVSIAAVSLGMEEAALKKKAPQLALDPYGCFGEKHQYLCKQSGVSVVVTTYKGLVKSVRFVAPPYCGFTREQSLSVARAMLMQSSGRKEVEHDDADRGADDMLQPVEYFYFDDGARLELTFAKNSRVLVETFFVSAG